MTSAGLQYAGPLPTHILFVAPHLPREPDRFTLREYRNFGMLIRRGSKLNPQEDKPKHNSH